MGIRVTLFDEFTVEKQYQLEDILRAEGFDIEGIDEY